MLPGGDKVTVPLVPLVEFLENATSYPPPARAVIALITPPTAVPPVEADATHPKSKPVTSLITTTGDPEVVVVGDTLTGCSTLEQQIVKISGPSG
jgi:hypothetical protein